jgi:hypothetical protein
MSEDEIKRKLEENVEITSSAYPIISFSKIKDYNGKINGSAFEIVGTYGFGKKTILLNPIIRGNISGNYVYIELELNKYQKFDFFGAYFKIVLIVVVSAAYLGHSQNSSLMDYVWTILLIFALCTLPILAIKIVFRKRKKQLGDFFKGTIEEG